MSIKLSGSGISSISLPEFSCSFLVKKRFTWQK